MKYWIEYGETGEIFFAGRSPDLPAPSRGGLVVEMPDAVDPSRSVFIGDELHDVGPRPSLLHVLDYATCEWVLWTPPGSTALQVAQDAKWAEIKAERDRLETAGFPYLGAWIDSDSRSVQRITGAVQSAQAALAADVPFEIGWTTADNSVLALDAQRMLGMTVALASYANGLHVVARQLREQIYAAGATEESVAAVAWPAEEVLP